MTHDDDDEHEEPGLEVERKKEELVFEMKVCLSDLRQRLHNRIEQRSYSLRHLQQL